MVSIVTIANYGAIGTTVKPLKSHYKVSEHLSAASCQCYLIEKRTEHTFFKSILSQNF